MILFLNEPFLSPLPNGKYLMKKQDKVLINFTLGILIFVFFPDRKLWIVKDNLASNYRHV